MSGPVFQQGCANGNSGATIFPVSFPGPNTPGNCIVVYVAMTLASGTLAGFSLLDNNNNIWAPLQFNQGKSAAYQAFIATNIQLPNSPTIALTLAKSGGGNVTRWSLCAAEYNNVSLDRGFISTAFVSAGTITLANQPGGPNITVLALDIPATTVGTISGPPTWTKRAGVPFSMTGVGTNIFDSTAFAGGTITFHDTNANRLVLVVLNPGATHQLDAYLIIEPAHFLDADIMADSSHVHFLDADLMADSSHVHFLDADLSQDSSHVHFLDADLSQDSSHVHFLDADLQADSLPHHFLDADLQTDSFRLHFLDADLSQDSSHVHFLDADLSKDSLPVHFLDAYLVSQSDRVHNLDAYLAGLGGGSHQLDAFIFLTDKSAFHNLDAFIFTLQPGTIRRTLNFQFNPMSRTLHFEPIINRTMNG